MTLNLPKPVAAYFTADRADGEAVSQRAARGRSGLRGRLVAMAPQPPQGVAERRRERRQRDDQEALRERMGHERGRRDRQHDIEQPGRSLAIQQLRTDGDAARVEAGQLMGGHDSEVKGRGGPRQVPPGPAHSPLDEAERPLWAPPHGALLAV